LPATEQAAREVLSLPLYVGLRPGEVGRVITAVHSGQKEVA
jgi:dTDP-4-amino-4,6-dideoxygalactose transaminase